MRRDRSWQETQAHRPVGCGYMGVELADGERGAMIVRVGEGSPADGAGLSPGREIVRIDGVRIRDFRHALRNIWSKRPGNPVTVTVLDRRGREREVGFTLARHPNE